MTKRVTTAGVEPITFIGMLWVIAKFIALAVVSFGVVSVMALLAVVVFLALARN